MSLPHVLLLLAAGLAAGTVNAVAGGGSLITFPALLGIGLAAKPANLTPATLVGGYVGARIARRLPGAVLRAIIVTFGLVVGGYLLYRAFR
jgi:uncharacterized protein